MDYKSLGININEDKCWGISWSSGNGKQCSRNKKDGNYCDKHNKCLECGDIYKVVDKPLLGKDKKPHDWNVKKKCKYNKSVSPNNDTSDNSIDDILLEEQAFNTPCFIWEMLESIF